MSLECPPPPGGKGPKTSPASQQPWPMHSLLLLLGWRPTDSVNTLRILVHAGRGAYATRLRRDRYVSAS